MTNILALDTSTDACSVALIREGQLSHRYELIPRQHSQRIFSLLDEVLPAGGLTEAGIELIAYNHGPGSFTGLRIAASAAQGLAFASNLPVVGVSTLASIAQGAWRRKEIPQNALTLVLIDARINEVYWGLYRFSDELAIPVCDDAVCSPEEVDPMALLSDASLCALGSGLKYLEFLPEALRDRLTYCQPECWPDSQDTLPLAEEAWRRGEARQSTEVHPVYLRNEISWKKVHEQGKRG